MCGETSAATKTAAADYDISEGLEIRFSLGRTTTRAEIDSTRRATHKSRNAIPALA